MEGVQLHRMMHFFKLVTGRITSWVSKRLHAVDQFFLQISPGPLSVRITVIKLLLVFTCTLIDFIILNSFSYEIRLNRLPVKKPLLSSYVFFLKEA